MRYLALLLATALFLGVLVPIAVSAESELKPSMKIWIYPDGSIELLYRLFSIIEIPLSPETKPLYAPKGDLSIDYILNIDNYSIVHKFKGLGRIKSDLTKGNLINEAEVLLVVNLAGAGNSTYGEIRGNAIFKLSSYARPSSKNISLLVKNIYIAIYRDQEEIEAEFTLNISGTEIQIPLNITKDYLNNKLKEKNIDYIEFREFEVKSSNKIYTIHTVISISIIRAIESAISQGIITKDEGERIRECFAKSFCEFYKLDSRFFLGLHSESYEKGINITFESEGHLAFGTNITKYMEINTECSESLYKLIQLIIQQLGTTQLPLPGISVKPMKSLFYPIIPSKNVFKLYVNLDVKNNTQLINIDLALATGRFRAINVSLDIKGTKSTLKTLKEFIFDEIMPLTLPLKSYLTQMGIKGGILPLTVELIEGKLNYVVAIPIDKVIELSKLDQAKIAVTSITTPPTITETMITINTPITKTTTVVKTKTTTITSFRMEMLTRIIPTTIPIITTTTAIERDWGTTVGIGATLLLVGIAIGYMLQRIKVVK